MKYVFVNLAQLICWALIAKHGCDTWEKSKNGDGFFTIPLAVVACILVHKLGRWIHRTFKKNDAVIGDYTLVVDDYSEMRRRFCDDTHVVKNPGKQRSPHGQ